MLNRSGRGAAHFFSAAAEAMRRILIESARKKASEKHGGKFQRVELQEFDLAVQETPAFLLALDEALTRLTEEEPETAEVVKLRFFAGFSIPETAELLEISVRTANRHWSFARAWLYRELAVS